MSKYLSTERKEKWREILSLILGPPWAKHFNTITKNIEALNWNLKPGFLWDQGPKISVEKLSELVQELKKVNILSQDIYIVSIDADYILVNIPKLLSTSQVLIKSNDTYLDMPEESRPILPGITKFIDVSNKKDGPQLVELGSSNYDSIKEMIKALLKLFRQYLDAPDSLNLHLALEVEQGWCVPTIFGILVGYPVVYWYDCDQNSYCVTLQVYKLIAENNFTLFAFSIPSSLEPSVHDYLDNWCKHTISNAVTAGGYFTNLKLVIKRVSMNAIVL